MNVVAIFDRWLDKNVKFQRIPKLLLRETIQKRKYGWSVWNLGTSIRMYLMKKVINLAVFFANGFIPEVKATKPATQVWGQVERRLKKAWYVDYYAQKRDGIKRDENFIQLLHVGFKAINYLAENDPYYANWLGYLMKRCYKSYGDSHVIYNLDLFKRLGSDPDFNKYMTSDLTHDPEQSFITDLKLTGGLRLIDDFLDKRD